MDIVIKMLTIFVVCLTLVFVHGKAAESCRSNGNRNRLEMIKLLQEDAKCNEECPATDLSEVMKTLNMVLENTESLLEQMKCMPVKPKRELIFRVRAGIGGDVYQGFVNGKGTDSSETCRKRATTCMYRSDTIDNWYNENIKKVRYSIRNRGAEVAFVEFSGRATSSTSWFSAGKVESSSWTDFRGNTFNFFSIAGHGTRNFYINRNYNGCPNDVGWTVILSANGHPCRFDVQSSYPTILYANSAVAKKPEPNGWDKADEVEIYIERE